MENVQETNRNRNKNLRYRFGSHIYIRQWLNPFWNHQNNISTFYEKGKSIRNRSCPFTLHLTKFGCIYPVSLHQRSKEMRALSNITVSPYLFQNINSNVSIFQGLKIYLHDYTKLLWL